MERYTFISCPFWLDPLQVHPDLPKQPLTPFFMFYSEKAKKFKKKHPEMPQYEISRNLAIKFKELPEHKKVKTPSSQFLESSLCTC